MFKISKKKHEKLCGLNLVLQHCIYLQVGCNMNEKNQFLGSSGSAGFTCELATLLVTISKNHTTMK